MEGMTNGAMIFPIRGALGQDMKDVAQALARRDAEFTMGKEI